MSEGSSSTKLTKKQQKAADFKAGKSGSGSGSASGSGSGSGSGSKGKGKKRDREATGGDVPEEDLLGEGEGEITGKTSAAAVLPKDTKKSKKDKKAAAEAADKEDGGEAKKQKRKRSQIDEDGEVTVAKASSSKSKDAKAGPSSSTKAKKMAFDEAGNATAVATEAAGEEVAEGAKGKKKAKESGEEGGGARRLIVFVGNMSFKSTATEIASHFKSHCSETPTVRLLTTRSSASSTLSASKLKSIAKGKAADTTIRSKGCAFLEFQSAPALQKALGLHHTLFGGRTINVELTAGGGGKGAGRQKKIEEKNSKLDEERKKLHEKYVVPSNEERKKKGDEKRERGEEVGPPRKKVRKGDEGEAQWGKRGGAPPAPAAGAGAGGGAKKQPRWMASGANAVRLTG